MQKLLVFLFLVSIALAQNSTCNPLTTCANNGVCNPDGLCSCNPAFATVDPTQQCAYERKSGLVAFLLQFFLGGLGVAEFYLGNISYAMGQCIILFITNMFSIFIFYYSCWCSNHCWNYFMLHGPKN